MAEVNRGPIKRKGKKQQAVPVSWWTARETMPDDIGSSTRPVLDKWLKENTEEWYYQLEKGGEAGRLHYQILFKMATKSRVTNIVGTRHWDTMREELRSEPGGYLEPCSTRAQEAIKKYCSKDDTRVEGPWTSKPIYMGSDLACMERPYPWQKFVLDTIQADPDDRSVYWLFDSVGKKGKSKLTKYLAFNKLAKTIGVDTASRLASALIQAGPRRAYVIDIPRTLCKDKSITSIINVIESLKNGQIQDNMYGRNEELFFDPPHVFVLSNYPPPREMLSADRWMVFEITADNDVAAVPGPVGNDAPIVVEDDMVLDDSQHAWAGRALR